MTQINSTSRRMIHHDDRNSCICFIIVYVVVLIFRCSILYPTSALGLQMGWHFQRQAQATQIHLIDHQMVTEKKIVLANQSRRTSQSPWNQMSIPKALVHLQMLKAVQSLPSFVRMDLLPSPLQMPVQMQVLQMRHQILKRELEHQQKLQKQMG